MHYIINAFVAVVAVCEAAALASAQPPPSDLVQAELLADVTGVQSGQTFTLGVLFEMKPEWHIYWHNPGESGLATSVRFELPEGMKAGPLLWPAPTRFVQPGDILGYGYSGLVLLAARVNVTGELSGMLSIPIRAKTRWLSCRDVCIPGHADLELSLPVSTSSKPANVPLFDKWEGDLPVEAFSAGVEVSATGKLPRDGSAGEFALHLIFRNAPTQVMWFPYSNRALRLTDASVVTKGAEADIRFKASLLKGHDLSSNELPAVVTYQDAGGRRKAIRVLVPLKSTD